jgi:hypothetical protein
MIMANGIIVLLYEFEQPSRSYSRLQAVRMYEFRIVEHITCEDSEFGKVRLDYVRLS